MKLEVKMVFRGDLEERLNKNKVIKNNFDIDNAAYFWSDFDTDIVRKIIEESVNTSGMRIYANVVLSRKELEFVKCYEVRAKAILKIPSIAQEENDKYMKDQPYVITSNKTRIKLRRKIYIGGNVPKPNIIVGLEYSEAYICSRKISNIFLGENLRGYVEYPVIKSRAMEVVAEYALIGAENVLSPLEEDITILPMDGSPSNDMYYRRLGLPSYSGEAIDGLYDFNYTAESYGDDSPGLLVVSSLVKEICKKNNIGGLDFVPVLDRSTRLYDQYIEKFLSLLDSLSVNPNNDIS